MCKAVIHTLNKGDGMTLTASAALVVDGDLITLVDPASLGNLQEIVSAVERKGVAWASVNQVFYTHLHFDHYDAFNWPEHIKRVFMPKQEVDYVQGLMQHKDSQEAYVKYLQDSHELIARPFLRQFIHARNDVRYSSELLQASTRNIHYDGEYAISDYCKSFPLPGHCVGLHGLVVEMAKGRGIIASDAVLSERDWRAEDIKTQMILSDSKAWWETRKNLKQFDWILPGHGDPFIPH